MINVVRLKKPVLIEKDYIKKYKLELEAEIEKIRKSEKIMDESFKKTVSAFTKDKINLENSLDLYQDLLKKSNEREFKKILKFQN